jgi:hypothetical protein
VCRSSVGVHCYSRVQHLSAKEKQPGLIQSGLQFVIEFFSTLPARL